MVGYFIINSAYTERMRVSRSAVVVNDIRIYFQDTIIQYFTPNFLSGFAKIS